MGITACLTAGPSTERQKERGDTQLEVADFLHHLLLWLKNVVFTWERIVRDTSPLPVTSEAENRESQSWAKWDPAHLSRFLELLHPSWLHPPDLWSHRKSVEAFRLLIPGLWLSPASSVPCCALRGSSSLVTSLLSGQVRLWCDSAPVPSGLPGSAAALDMPWLC